MALLEHKVAADAQGNFRLNDQKFGGENSSGWQLGPTVDIREEPYSKQQCASREDQDRAVNSAQEGGGHTSAVQVSAATPVDPSPTTAMLTENSRVSVLYVLVHSCFRRTSLCCGASPASIIIVS